MKDLNWQVLKIKDSENVADELVFIKVVLKFTDASGVFRSRGFMMTVNEFYEFFRKFKELKEYFK